MPEQSHRGLQLLLAARFCLVHASPHALTRAAPQLDPPQQSSPDTHLSFASVPEEGLLQAWMPSAAPVPGRAQPVLLPGGKKKANTEEQSDMPEAMHELPHPQAQWGIPPSQAANADSGIACLYPNAGFQQSQSQPSRLCDWIHSPSYPSSPRERSPVQKSSGAAQGQQPC